MVSILPYSANMIGAPAVDGVVITPSNSTVLNPMIRGFYVGVTGDVKIRTPGGTDLNFVAVPAGGFIPWCADKIYSTSTTATNIIGVL